MKQQTINDHIDQESKVISELAKRKGKPFLSVLKRKHKYMKRCLDLYYLGLHAIKYNDGTDRKLFDLSKKRKQYYINKLISQ